MGLVARPVPHWRSGRLVAASCATTSSPRSATTGGGCCAASAPSSAIATGRPPVSSSTGCARPDSTLTLHVRSDGLGSSFAGVVRVEARAGRLRRALRSRVGARVRRPTGPDSSCCTRPSSPASELRGDSRRRAVEASHASRAAISPHQPVFDIAAPRVARTTGSRSTCAFDGRRVRDGGSAQLVGCLVQDVQPPARPPVSRTRSTPASAYARRCDRRPRGRDARGRQPAPMSRIELRRGGPFPEILVGGGDGARSCCRPALPIAPSGVLVELDLGSPNWRAALDRAPARAVLPLDVRVIAAGRAADSTRSRDAGRALLSATCRHRCGSRAFDPVLHVTDAAAAGCDCAQRSDAAGVDVPVIGGRALALHRVQPRARAHPARSRRHRVRHDAALPLARHRAARRVRRHAASDRSADGRDGRRTPVHIGPVTLRPRFNDVATAPSRCRRATTSAEGYGAEFTGAVDPRQSAPELAAWTVASAAALAVPGVASIAWFEEWGPARHPLCRGRGVSVAAAMRCARAR